MKLKEMVSKIVLLSCCGVVSSDTLQTTSVSGREYSEWRETGLAFQLRKDVPYKASNQTLASGLLVTQVL